MPNPRKVSPGQPLRASAWNQIIDSLPGSRSGTGGGVPAGERVALDVINNSGADRGIGELLAIVDLDNLGDLPEVEQRAVAQAVYQGELWQSAESQRQLVVTAEPIPDGQVGVCTLLGHCVLRVTNATEEGTHAAVDQATPEFAKLGSAGDWRLLAKLAGDFVLATAAGGGADLIYGEVTASAGTDQYDIDKVYSFKSGQITPAESFKLDMAGHPKYVQPFYPGANGMNPTLKDSLILRPSSGQITGDTPATAGFESYEFVGYNANIARWVMGQVTIPANTPEGVYESDYDRIDAFWNGYDPGATVRFRFFVTNVLADCDSAQQIDTMATWYPEGRLYLVVQTQSGLLGQARYERIGVGQLEEKGDCVESCVWQWSSSSGNWFIYDSSACGLGCACVNPPSGAGTTDGELRNTGCDPVDDGSTSYEQDTKCMVTFGCERTDSETGTETCPDGSSPNDNDGKEDKLKDEKDDEYAEDPDLGTVECNNSCTWRWQGGAWFGINLDCEAGCDCNDSNKPEEDGTFEGQEIKRPCERTAEPPVSDDCDNCTPCGSSDAGLFVEIRNVGATQVSLGQPGLVTWYDLGDFRENQRSHGGCSWSVDGQWRNVNNSTSDMTISISYDEASDTWDVTVPPGPNLEDGSFQIVGSGCCASGCHQDANFVVPAGMTNATLTTGLDLTAVQTGRCIPNQDVRGSSFQAANPKPTASQTRQQALIDWARKNAKGDADALGVKFAERYWALLASCDCLKGTLAAMNRWTAGDVAEHKIDTVVRTIITKDRSVNVKDAYLAVADIANGELA